MDVLAEIDGKIFVRGKIEQPEDLASPFSGDPFPCLIWDHDGRFTDAARTAVAHGLLEAGCRYAVCAGQNCEAWENAVDLAFVEAYLDEESVQDAAHVMTSSHDRESPDDVAFFFVLCTNFDSHDFRRYLVLHIGIGSAEEDVDEAVQKHVRAAV
jgi:hypothetical protein